MTTSKIESSVYADTKLFLKHQVMEEDFALPQLASFLEACPTVDACPVCPVEGAC